MWWMLFPRWIWFLFGQLCVLRPVRAMTISKVVYSHAGMCPNEMNPNLWVDAMSTCMRECDSEQGNVISSSSWGKGFLVFLFCCVLQFARLRRACNFVITFVLLLAFSI